MPTRVPPRLRSRRLYIRMTTSVVIVFAKRASQQTDVGLLHVCCAAKVANAGRGGGGGLAGGVDHQEEVGEEGQAGTAAGTTATTTAAAWRMLYGYERSREAAVMVDALTRVVAGGGGATVAQQGGGARREVLSPPPPPEGAWPGYDYEYHAFAHSAPAHGNHICISYCIALPICSSSV